jgi:winged helix-turn-helix DNA-binding protein
MADFLTQKRTEIEERLKELRPLHEEYLKLQRAKEALDGVDTPRRGRPRGSTTGSASGNGRRRRRRRGSTRGDEALNLIRQNPGVTVSELARMMHISPPNYLYRVVGNLQSDGAVKKQGKGYVAA